jgi:hypothetical protein
MWGMAGTWSGSRSSIFAIQARLARNTYYGQWPREKAPNPGLESPAIAHNEV